MAHPPLSRRGAFPAPKGKHHHCVSWVHLGCAGSTMAPWGRQQGGWKWVGHHSGGQNSQGTGRSGKYQVCATCKRWRWEDKIWDGYVCPCGTPMGPEPPWRRQQATSTAADGGNKSEPEEGGKAEQKNLDKQKAAFNELWWHLDEEQRGKVEGIFPDLVEKPTPKKHTELVAKAAQARKEASIRVCDLGNKKAKLEQRVATLKKELEETTAKVQEVTLQWKQAEEEHTIATKAHEDAVQAADKGAEEEEEAEDVEMPQGEPAGSDPEEHKVCGPAEVPQPPEEYKKWKEQLPEATRKDLEEYFEALASSKQAKPRIKRTKKGDKDEESKKPKVENETCMAAAKQEAAGIAAMEVVADSAKQCR